MLCKYCGAELPDGTEKCGFCGAELAEEQSLEDTKIIEIPEGETADETETETEAETEEEILDENEIKRREQMEKMLEEKRLQLSEIEKRRNVKKRRQQQTRILIIAAVCIAGVIAVASWSYLVKNNQDNTVVVTPPPTATPTATVPVLTPTPRTTTPEPLGSTAPARDTERTWEATGNNSGTSSASGTSGTSGTSSRGTSGSSTAAASGGSTATSAGTSSGGSASNSGSTGSSQSANASTLNSAKASGASSHTIDAKLSVGGEVIKDGGKNLMTFASGGTLYYANVSEGSTTEQIKNQDMTVTAYPTEESYNGNTIYEITSLTYYNGDGYILPNSGTKLLTTSDISSLSKSQLALARNEIYARHGRKFQHAEFRDYFSQKSWYRENENYNYSDESLNLNEIEVKNVGFLLKVENSK